MARKTQPQKMSSGMALVLAALGLLSRPMVLGANTRGIRPPGALISTPLKYMRVPIAMSAQVRATRGEEVVCQHDDGLKCFKGMESHDGGGDA